MPSLLISRDTGTARPGRYTGPVTINLKDLRLKSAMGTSLPRALIPLRYRQFIFFGVSDGDFTAGLALADLKYVQQAFFYVRNTGGSPPELQVLDRRFFPDTNLDPEAEFPDFCFSGSALKIHFRQKRLQVFHGNTAFDLMLGEEPPPLRLCTRTGREGWTFTRKSSPVKAHGIFRQGAFCRSLNPDACRVLTDRTCGLLRRETFWNWAAAAGRLPDGRDFGMNLAWGVNETGFTENRVWLAGTPFDLGPLIFTVPEQRSRHAWRVHSEDTSLDLRFHPDGFLSQRFNAGILATDFIQNTGCFSGHIHLPSAEKILLSGMRGWTEDHYVRW